MPLLSPLLIVITGLLITHALVIEGTESTDSEAGASAFPRSVLEWSSKAPHLLSIVSFALGFHSDSRWYIPSLHADGSIGRNRSYLRNVEYGDSLSCSLKFYGMGLASHVKGYELGGTATIDLSYFNSNHQPKIISEEASSRILCYYTTSFNVGSDFNDDPKTYGFAIYCPVYLDDEIRRHDFRQKISQGRICRALSDHQVTVELTFLPSTLYGKLSTLKPPSELRARFVSTPASLRYTAAKEPSRLLRPHAVCTVQTFRNQMTGPMLFMFASYWQRLGWRAIIYDRFGNHHEFLKSLLHLPGIDYYPYTILQMTVPTKYNSKYQKRQVFTEKFYYRKEKRHGYEGTPADTPNQDHDKSRTYDYCRIEYAYLDSILFIDSDEYLYCPLTPPNNGLKFQRQHQQQLMTEFASRGIDEMRFVRLPYAGKVASSSSSLVQASNTTKKCMLNAYASRDLLGMFACWSSASSFDHYGKSADFGSVCPFHYNHWSCDGQQSGGRDKLSTPNMRQCRCKVAFDMSNGYSNTPMPEFCHLMHLNDKKYSYEAVSRRANDVVRGSTTQENPVTAMLQEV